jgi:hypothetical protein
LTTLAKTTLVGHAGRRKYGEFFEVHMETMREKNERREQSPKFQERVVARWNKLHPVGTWVRYFEIEGEGKPLVTQTTTPAQMLSGHTAVVWLKGKIGCVAIYKHCKAIT